MCPPRCQSLSLPTRPHQSPPPRPRRHHRPPPLSLPPLPTTKRFYSPTRPTQGLCRTCHLHHHFIIRQAQITATLVLQTLWQHKCPIFCIIIESAPTALSCHPLDDPLYLSSATQTPTTSAQPHRYQPPHQPHRHQPPQLSHTDTSHLSSATQTLAQPKTFPLSPPYHYFTSPCRQPAGAPLQ